MLVHKLLWTNAIKKLNGDETYESDWQHQVTETEFRLMERSTSNNPDFTTRTLQVEEAMYMLFFALYFADADYRTQNLQHHTAIEYIEV